MAFQTAITIKETLDNIQGRRYMMPAIQREFVWSTEQIERLFDSLMQGYPIGSLLFWEVQADTVKKYKWYGFMREYHKVATKHNPEFEPLDNHSNLTAVLDGQQRLTALNIGLRGSYAEKLYRKHGNNPDAFPAKKLYLKIDSDPEEDGTGTKFEFKFLTASDYANKGGADSWFKVEDVLAMEYGDKVNEYIENTGLQGNEHRPQMRGKIEKLREAVHLDKPISFFLEKSQDLDKVLNIFIRTNSGGTQLAYSDLLLSIATAQWQHKDAREEVNNITDTLNGIGDGFGFTRDFILKAGLVLTDDISSIGFKVGNFTKGNMQALENGWDAITRAVWLAVELVRQFGLSGGKLTSQNSLHPIACYLHSTGKDESFLDAVGHQEEREDIKRWLFRTLLKKRSPWGGSSDTVLTHLRGVISNETSFPVQKLEESLRSDGYDLTFPDEELEDLVDEPKGKTFVLLCLLYPDRNIANSRFDIDHVFPRSRLTEHQLRKAGVDEDQVDEIQKRVDGLPNKLLLPASENASKGNKMPAEWLRDHFATEQERQEFKNANDLGDIPEDVSGFVRFYEERKQRLLNKLRKLIGQPASDQ